MQGTPLTGGATPKFLGEPNLLQQHSNWGQTEIIV